MNALSKLFQKPFIHRSSKNKHRYVVLGKTISTLTTWKKDMEYLVAQLMGHGQSGLLSAFTPTIQKAAAAGALLAMMSTQSALALPVNPNVVSGQVTFNETANQLEATVGTQNSTIHWDSFNIAENESVLFNFLRDNSISLNRVLGGDASKIYGNLSGNGTIFLINQAGILFGPGATVNVSNLVASTVNVTSANFVDGKFTFEGAGGSVINEGTITVDEGGYALLAGSAVQNSGSINALNGQVAMVAGEKLAVATSDGLFVEVTEGVQTALSDFSDAVSNTGSISSASAVLQANLDGALYRTAINNEGQIHASNVRFGENGVVELLASGGDIVQSGTIVAESGDITIRSDQNTLLASNSLTSANGGVQGDGGNIIVWADDITNFESGATLDVSGGSQGGNGGFVEVSAKDTVVFQGEAKGDSVDGVGGHILIDPTKIVFQNGGAAAGGNTINANDAPVPGTTTLDPASFSGFNNVTVEALEDIQIKDDLILTNVNQVSESATFRAGRNIDVEARVQTFGGHINMTADADLTGSGGAASDGVGNINIKTAGSLDSGTGNVNLNGIRVINEGSVTGENITAVAKERIQNKAAGSISANQDVTFDVDQYGDIDNDGLIESSNGNILMEAWLHNAHKEGSDITNDGIIRATNGTVELTAGDDITNRGTGLITGQQVNINVTGDFLNNTDATISASTSINIANGTQAAAHNWRDVSNKGTLTSDSLTIETGDDINFGTTSTVNTTGAISLKAGDDIKTEAGSTTSGQSLNINGTGDVILSGNTTSSTGNIDVAGEDITNNATIQSNSGGAVSLVAADQTVNTGIITTSGDITLKGGDAAAPTSGNLVNNDGGSIMGRKITINSGDRVNNRSNGTIMASAGLDIDAADQVLNQSGSKLQANGGELTIDSNHLDNSGLIKTTNQNIVVNTVEHIDNEAGGSMDAGSGNITLDAGTRVHNIGNASIIGNNVDIDAGNLNTFNGAHTAQNEGTINASGTVSIDAGGNVTQKSGSIQGREVNLNTAGDIQLTNGNITSFTSMDFDANGKITNSNVTNTAQNGNINWDAGTNIENRASVSATNGNIIMNANDDLTNTATGNINANGDVTLRAGIDNNFVDGDDFLNQGMIEGNNVTIKSADDLNNNGGSIIARSGNVDLFSADDTEHKNGATLTANQSIISNAGGKFVATNNTTATNGNITVNASESIRNDATMSAAQGSVTLDSDGLVKNDTNGSIIALGDVNLLAGDSGAFQEGDDVDNAGSILTEGRLTMDAGDDIQNRSGASINANEIDGDAADNIDNAAGASMTAEGTLALTTGAKTTHEEGRDIDNAGTLTSTNGLLDLDAGDDITNKPGGIMNGVTIDIKTADNFTNHNTAQVNASDSLTVEACDEIRNDGVLGTTSTNTVSLTAENNMFGSGLTQGGNITLTATNGSIGTGAQAFNTNATNLAATAGTNININEANSVILGNLTAGGSLNFTNANNFPGIFDPLPTGTVRLDGLLSGNTVDVTALGSIIDGDTPALNVLANGNSSLVSQTGTVGLSGDPIEVSINGGSLTVGASGANNGVSVNINGNVSPSNTLNIQNPLPPGSVLFNGNFLSLAGLGDGLLNQSLPFLTVNYNTKRSVFEPTLNVEGTIGSEDTKNTSWSIINERGDSGQLFDLRLLEEEDNGEPVILLQLVEDGQ